MQGLSWQGQPLFDVARVVDLFPFRGASDASKAWRSAIADSDIVEASAGLLDDLLRLDSPELVLVPGGSAQKALNSEQLAGKLRNVTRLRQVRQPCYFWAAQGMTKDRISASWRLAIGRADRR